MNRTPKAYLCLVLHAHLPFVRHPEHARFLEEDWLFEAISETYLPLLRLLEGWSRDGVEYRLTLTLSPTLCEMLADPLLQDRYTAHVERLVRLSEAEVERLRGQGPLEDTARMYLDHFRDARERFGETCKRDLVSAFAAHQRTGRLEVLTCAATHALLPLVLKPESRRAQIRVAVENYRRHFGVSPRGLWLPECGYAPGLEHEVKRAGLEYFFLDTHGVLLGTPRPRFGPFAPIECPGGVAAFARDVESSRQVWSAGEGYPGDPYYREFYRDLGYDAPLEHLLPYLHPDGVRRNVGIKYHRITGSVGLHDKQPYEPAKARARAEEHARHFASERGRQAHALRERLGTPPTLVAPYDAELFGHWWFEGPLFLDRVVRTLAARPDVRLATARECLARTAHLQPVQPSLSTWGRGGYHEMWLNGANDWVYPHLHHCEERMVELATRFREPGTIAWRALNQAARELLLAQSSDWPFILSSGTAVPYAEKRFRSHVTRFLRLDQALHDGRLDTDLLGEMENQDNLFAELDYSVFRGEVG